MIISQTELETYTYTVTLATHQMCFWCVYIVSGTTHSFSAITWPEKSPQQSDVNKERDKIWLGVASEGIITSQFVCLWILVSHWKHSNRSVFLWSAFCITTSRKKQHEGNKTDYVKLGHKPRPQQKPTDDDDVLLPLDVWQVLQLQKDAITIYTEIQQPTALWVFKTWLCLDRGIDNMFKVSRMK